jgi:hypothetical protein
VTSSAAETAALPDGVYTAEFDTDSSMFHANEACDGKGTLTVENGQMTFHVSLASTHIVNLYLGKLAVACTVYPNLNDKALQDSYKVMGAENLLKTMLTSGEYAEYLQKVQEVCGFDVPLQDEVDDAKN